jgi:hypothetical protein
MRAERLYEKVMLEAERDWEQQEERERLEIIRLNTQQPDTNYEQNIKKLCRLVKATFDMECELEAIKQVAKASEQHLFATMRLRAAKRTPAEKKARDADLRAGQIAFSRITSPENYPDWRQHATAEFRNKKLVRYNRPPPLCSKPENRLSQKSQNRGVLVSGSCASQWSGRTGREL